MMEFVNGKDDIPYVRENKTCLKFETTSQLDHGIIRGPEQNPSQEARPRAFHHTHSSVCRTIFFFFEAITTHQDDQAPLFFCHQLIICNGVITHLIVLNDNDFYQAPL